MSRCLKHGVLAGLAGGAALAAALWLIGERSIADAIALEQSRHGGVVEREVYGRGAQQAGGLVASALYGMAAGAVFSVAYALVRPHLTHLSAWATSVRLAGMGFAAVFLLPFLRYPANPPGVGDPATVTERTVLHVAATGWSVLSVWAGWRAWRALVARGWPAERRLPAAVAMALALACTGLSLLPANPDAVPAPASLVWEFRMGALAGSVAMWAVLGTAFGWIQDGSQGRRRATSGPVDHPGTVVEPG